MKKIIELAEKIIILLNKVRLSQNSNFRDWFCTIPSPSGVGGLYIGEEGQQAFYEILRIYCEKNNNDDPRYDLNDLVAPLKQKFSDRFLKKGLSVNEESLARILSQVFTDYEQSWKKSSYYLPCNLFTSVEVEPFEIGSVKFIPTEQFLEKNLRQLEEGSNCSPVLDSFKRHNWVAIAAVEKCSSKVAEKTAYKAVEFAIATLQLVWGADQTDCFKIEESHQATARNWAIEVDGNFECGWSRDFGRSFPAEWKDSLLDLERRKVISFSATVLNKCLSFELIDRLDNLIMESILMYQNAIRESDYYIKIMKYVFSAEALLLPVRTNCISKKFKTRFAAVLSTRVDEYEEKLSFFHDAYGLRSDVAHGSFEWKYKSKKDISTAVLDLDVACLIFEIICFRGSCVLSGKNSLVNLDKALTKLVSDVEEFSR